ncbi:hypothetical protein D9757_004987 [Collybiopsis confluens]|uniref:Beta-galactosidase n=1 Tax=Collybiopsis confluens TaxID=2823264 RepID=A0A8H5MCP6_9AGAR|nr:hypothetical protein D9757_004987 [Collybiopsis confluens]
MVHTGETAFIFSSKPTVNLGGAPNTTSTFSNNTLTLQYSLNGSQFVTISNGNSKIVVVILDKTAANQWNAPVLPSSSGSFPNHFSIGSNNTVLVGGPYVVRNASITGDVLSLAGDLNGTTTIEFIAPAAVTSLRWNGALASVTKNSQGIWTGTVTAGSPNFTLPTLANLSWKVSGSLPEIDPNFDDSNFTLADITTTNYTNLPPLAGSQVLYAQQYGFYGGNLIFRGRFNATGKETGVNLTVQYGFAGGYSVFLNGVFLGSSQGSSTVSLSSNVWTFPSGVLKSGAENIIQMEVKNREEFGDILWSEQARFSHHGGYKAIRLGGASEAPDTFRGYLNEGGLYAERIGAHLPGFPDGSWATGSPLTGVSKAGINFYRTTFNLSIPQGFDVPVRLSITPSAISSNFRAQIYLNGWQIGKYFNNIGILFRDSTNTLAISLWSLDSAGASIAGLGLVADGVFTTALRFQDYVGPDFDSQLGLRPEGTMITPMSSFALPVALPSLASDDDLSPVSSSTRSVVGIIWSCVTTIFACTWIAVHPNLPSEDDSEWTIYWRRARIMMVALIVPEYVIL